jgi:FkbM family methyltransferase
VAREHPTSQVYVYEPLEESFALLQKNIALNMVHNITPFPFAIGATDGPLLLAATGQAVQYTTTSSTVSGQVASTTQVQGITLGQLFSINNLKCCDFLKIDCEGGEFDILFNASPDTLERIKHICLEYHNGFTQYTHTDLANYLRQNGFAVKITPNPVHNYLGLLYAYRA